MAPVGLAFEDELVSRRLQPVDGGLGQQGIGQLAQPLDGLPVGGDNRRRGPVALDYQLVYVSGVQGVHGLEGKIIQDQQICPDQLSDLGVMAVVEP